MSRVASVEEAEAAFYAAFQNGDIDAMAAVWEPSEHTVCIHPRGLRLVGFDRIMQSWKRILKDTRGFRISIELVRDYSHGDLSVRFVNETVFNELTRSDPVTLLATNAYRKTQSGWRIVLHHASPQPAPDTDQQHAEPPDSSVTLH